MGAPLPYRWTGEAWEPLPGFRRRADAEFVVGEVVRLEVIESRSEKSHNHYFAAISETWRSLPEDLVDQFPSPEHLRKRALIATGYRDQTSIVASTKAEARRLATFVRPIDEFSVVSVNECVVVRMVAKSQSLKAMGAKEFQASKTAVLDWISDLLGTTREALNRTAGRVA